MLAKPIKNQLLLFRFYCFSSSKEAPPQKAFDNSLLSRITFTLELNLMSLICNLFVLINSLVRNFLWVSKFNYSISFSLKCLHMDSYNYKNNQTQTPSKTF